MVARDGIEPPTRGFSVPCCYLLSYLAILSCFIQSYLLGQTFEKAVTGKSRKSGHWCLRTDSNCRHNGYEPFFLPAEILRHICQQTQLASIQRQYCRIFWFPACQNQLTENGFIQASIAVFHPFKAQSWIKVTPSLLGPANSGRGSTATPMTRHRFIAERFLSDFSYATGWKPHNPRLSSTTYPKWPGNVASSLRRT